MDQLYYFFVCCKDSQKFMHLFQVAFFSAGAIYALLHQQQLILYFLLIVALYIVISFILPGAKSLSTRKKIMVACWPSPSEGNIYLRQPVRVEKVQKIIEEYSKEGKTHLSMTHFVIKACGQMLKKADDLNGYFSFGKFLPHQSKDISCPVDIGKGRDTAFVLIKEVDKKSVIEIAEYIQKKVSEIRKNSGDEEHKKRENLTYYLPSFIIGISINVLVFLTMKLGLNIPSLSFKRGEFGSGVVSAVGKFGFQDAFAPLGFCQIPFIAVMNAIKKIPVVQEDESVKIGKVMNVNFTIDHRYLDGARGQQLIEVFKGLFQQPEKYLSDDESFKQIKQDKKQ